MNYPPLSLRPNTTSTPIHMLQVLWQVRARLRLIVGAPPSQGGQLFLMGKRSKLLGVLRSKKSNAMDDQDESISVPAQDSQSDELPQASKRSSVLQKLLFSNRQRPPPLQQVPQDGFTANKPDLERMERAVVPTSPEDEVRTTDRQRPPPPQQFQENMAAANEANLQWRNSFVITRSPEYEERDAETERPPPPLQVQENVAAANEADSGGINSTVIPTSPAYRERDTERKRPTPPHQVQKNVPAVKAAGSERRKPTIKPTSPEDEERNKMAKRAKLRRTNLDMWRTSPVVLVKHMSSFTAEEDNDVILWVLRQLRAVDKGKWHLALTAAVEESVEHERCGLLCRIETMDTVQEREHKELMDTLGEICASRVVASWLEQRGNREAFGAESTLRWVLPHSKRGDTDQWQRITSKLVLAFARFGRLETLAAVVENGGDISPQNVDENGNTALHLAAARGHAAVVRYLLDNGANGYVKNKRNWTPKHSAGENGHRACFFILHDALNPGMVPLVEGVNVPRSTPRDDDPWWWDIGDGFSDRLGAYDRPLPGGGANPNPLRQSGTVIPMRARPFADLERRMNGGA